ncbi:MAG: adenosylcobalamin-dependent ribonucleoside-diphosphate reductase [Acidobacteriia bacterium]|nr:adenosylcobalamin-dependent ribonucleoside-diphosphate reductase [Terriglobia bacterium]
MGMNLTSNAQMVFEKRYLRRDPEGKVCETVEELFRRVAQAVSQSEAHYKGALSLEEVEQKFFDMMATLEFLPNSPTLRNAGTPLGQLSGCFVLPIEDSMESIYSTLRDAALIQKSGGGTGFSFSRLRPRNDDVASTRGISSGPVSFMRLYNYSTEINRLGGARAGANMAVLRYDHPDIMEFVTSKSNDESLNNFNLSVAVTDDFMDRLKKDDSFELVNPRTGKPQGSMHARELFEKVTELAWATGDPGLVFLDRINRDNPTAHKGAIEATNPCGEQPLLPYESCNLGSINLAAHMMDGRFDLEKFQETVRWAVRFLDDVIEANQYPLEKTAEITHGNRKIGLGLMGFADVLIQMGIAYDSMDARKFGEHVMSTLQREAREASCELAEQRGVFPNFRGSRYDVAGGERLRNATVTTIAPTGTLSLIADCSSGIEPLFALSYFRNILGEERAVEIHPAFAAVARDRGFFSERLMEALAEQGSIADLGNDGRHAFAIPEDVKKIFKTAHDIAPSDHVRMQATFQQFTDSAVSKTVNLRASASVEDVAEVYRLAHEMGCKGITIFRDTSKRHQVLRKPAVQFELKSITQREATVISGWGETERAELANEICGECGGPIEHSSGCLHCRVCGYTVCQV